MVLSEQKKKYMREYNLKNREKILLQKKEYHKKFRQQHKDELKTKNQIYNILRYKWKLKLCQNEDCYNWFGTIYKLKTFCDDCIKKRANTYYVTKNINKTIFDELVAKRVQEIQNELMQNGKKNN